MINSSGAIAVARKRIYVLLVQGKGCRNDITVHELRNVLSVRCYVDPVLLQQLRTLSESLFALPVQHFRCASSAVPRGHAKRASRSSFHCIRYCRMV